MEICVLRSANIERDFRQLASLFTLEQDEPTTESGLIADYEEHQQRIFRLMVAEDEQGDFLGFNWATRSRFEATEAYFYVIVKPDQRGQGVGGRLYDDVEYAALGAKIKKLQVDIRDTCPECRAFALRRGLVEKRHSIGMTLDLSAFDDRLYSETIEKLQAEGFLFTSMGAMGNTEEAQRKLYALNDMTSSEIPGSEGERSWLSFEDFQQKVCQSNWYRPDGQMVVIDAASGEWVGMSAITCFDGTDYAYNLHTGVDRRYRGRKLAQSVKVLALRYARDVLTVTTVRTHHNSNNAPMIAIDRKLGYVQSPGIFHMEKELAP